MQTFPETNQFITTLSKELGTAQNNAFPWMPLPEEDLQSYMAFEVWRDMGIKRPAQQHLTAKQFNWGARALAYDTWVQSQNTDIRQMADQISKTLMKASGTALEAIQVELIKVLRTLGNTGVSTMTLPEILKSIETLAKTSRLLADKSTENVAVVVGTADLGRLTDAELDEMERLRRKASTALPG
jgi:hypothetical protein